MDLIDLHCYGFSYFAIPNLIVGSGILCLGFYVMYREHMSSITMTFFLTTLSLGGWQFSNAAMCLANNPATALTWTRLQTLFVAFIPEMACFFAYTVTRQYRRFKVLAWANVAVACAFVWMVYFTPWLISGVSRYFWGYNARYGPAGFPFITLFGVGIVQALVIYWTGSKRAVEHKQKQRLKLISIGVLIGFPGATDFLPDFGIPFYTFGYISVFIMVSLWAYAVLRYRLVDITPSFAVDQIIGTMAEALLVVDREGVVRVANAAAADLFSLPAGTLAGLPLPQVTHGLLKLDQMESLIQLGPFRDREIHYASPEGKNRYLNVSASVALDNDRQPAAFVILAKDITDRKHLESVALRAQKMSAIGQLAAGVAHEINNPLGVILGFAQSLVHRLPPNDPDELPLKSIEREAIRCRNLVQDLLTFSRVSKTEMEPVDVNRTIESALPLVTAQARIKHIDVQTNFAADLPRLLGNSNQIQQIIVNLAANAFDAIGETGTVAIQTKTLHEGPLSWIGITVTDTGPGIPPDILPRIFDPFFTTKPIGKGTGLGLSLVHEIVQKHSGTIDVQSVPGHTEFRVKFPVRVAPNPFPKR